MLIINTLNKVFDYWLIVVFSVKKSFSRWYHNYYSNIWLHHIMYLVYPNQIYCVGDVCIYYLAKSVLLHFARKLCWIRTSSTCRITCGCLSYNYGVRWLMNSVNNPCRGRMLTFRNCFEKKSAKILHTPNLWPTFAAKLRKKAFCNPHRRADNMPDKMTG